MPIFTIIFTGSFHLNDELELSLESGEPVAGFYTARAVEATDQQNAISEASDAIQKELSEIFAVTPAEYQLEIESIEEAEDWPDFVSKGFAFYGAE